MPDTMGAKSLRPLGHRGKAVGGAGGGGDDVVVGRQRLVVDVVDNRRQVVAGRSGDDDLLGASVDVSLGLGLRGVEAGALEDDVDIKVAPRQVVGVGLLVDGNLVTIDGNGVLAGDDLVVASIVALRGVILQQVSEHLRRGEVVDGDDLGALVTEHLTEGQTTDATEAVDSNLDCHAFSFRRPPDAPCAVQVSVGNTISDITASAKNPITRHVIKLQKMPGTLPLVHRSVVKGERLYRIPWTGS